ncbi:NADH dehydrogenase [ubiquinone] 1 beta subcomplex subunit 2, mitochondrial [Anabrus simplex]|uniref:NADH dehydrogenase [ubiquinone] 1 beta subcomplex subunit 2, mitochondrial n=1 Tax=Anabrus simplex TaxID=316456 RepID=UPI0035A3D3B0
MLISRGIGPLRRILSDVQRPAKSMKCLRNSGTWSYRCAAPPPSKATLYTAEAVGGFMWWWVLWHLWHEHEHITGEFEYPDPRKWTDEELGIPPDDED